MTPLKQRISTDYITAFKSKDAVRKSILSVVKGDIQTVEKNTGVADLSDEDVMKILVKTVKNLNETLSQTQDAESTAQLAVLSEYMPKQLTREEVKAKVDELKAASDVPLNIGAVMKAFAMDAVDKKMVAEVFNEK